MKTRLIFSLVLLAAALNSRPIAAGGSCYCETAPGCGLVDNCTGGATPQAFGSCQDDGDGCREIGFSCSCVGGW